MSTNKKLVAMQSQEKNMQKNKYGLRLIGKTADGYQVCDRIDSHIHFDGGLTLNLLKDALSMVVTNSERFIKFKCRFKQTVGYTQCVPVTKTDNVLMVYRKGRKGMTPMVTGRKPDPCDSVIVVLKKDSTNPCYILVTAFIGKESEKEPWDTHIRTEEQRRRCNAFWSTHALIYDESQIDWDRTVF